MIIAVIPAAGQSRRMGVDKKLLPYAGTTVIGHIVDELLKSRLDEVRVVVGHHADQLRKELDPRGVRIIVNADYERTDMLASIRCGLAEMPADCRAMLIALGDQPAIRAELADAMIDAFATAGRGIVVPIHDGRRGHPLLLSASYRDQIMTGFDEVGLRGLLSAHCADVLELPVTTSAILSDMDHPDDYQRELARLGEREV